MEKLKYAVSNHMEGFEIEKTDYSRYETSFRRWLVSEVELGHMSVSEAAERFNFDKFNFSGTFKGWRLKYSSKIHIALQAMTPEELTELKKLQQRIKELEEQLEAAQIKNVLTEVMIDIAEEQFKIDIRKKPGPKQ
jgi:transposase-like protein